LKFALGRAKVKWRKFAKPPIVLRAACAQGEENQRDGGAARADAGAQAASSGGRGGEG